MHRVIGMELGAWPWPVGGHGYGEGGIQVSLGVLCLCGRGCHHPRVELSQSWKEGVSHGFTLGGSEKSLALGGDMALLASALVLHTSAGNVCV